MTDSLADDTIAFQSKWLVSFIRSAVVTFELLVATSHSGNIVVVSYLNKSRTAEINKGNEKSAYVPSGPIHYATV